MDGTDGVGSKFLLGNDWESKGKGDGLDGQGLSSVLVRRGPSRPRDASVPLGHPPDTTTLLIPLVPSTRCPSMRKSTPYHYTSFYGLMRYKFLSSKTPGSEILP